MSTRSTRNWTIVSLYYRDPQQVSQHYPMGWRSRCEKYVVYEPLKSIAERVVEEWLDAEPARRLHLEAIDYYPRNYVGMARDLSAQGRVIA